MAFWLIKSEPSVYPWTQFVKDRKTNWNGVRNHQAAANLKAMKKGDQAFFYHSNEGKEIVGIAEVMKEAYPDPTDETGKFVMVDFAPVKALKTPVSLAQIKSLPALKSMALVRQSRLSVSPVKSEEWTAVCKLGGV
ncbi:MAG: EVE domain-containing protein [Alphaproteobacteria bacterium]|nr:EVE domain-containing protein [Alphaproteobacteria bacterium]